MSRSAAAWGLAVPVLLLVLAATATAAIKPLMEEATQDDKPMHHLAYDMLPPQKEEPAAARIASAEDHLAGGPRDGLSSLKEEPAARVASAEPAARLADLRPAEKKDEGGDDAEMPTMEEAVRPTSGVKVQGGDPGTVPKAGRGDGNDSGKEQSGGSSSKEAEKSAAAAKSCLTKEECHKKRLLCGKGCTLSAHAKCAAKCSKSCIPTC
uniref:Uncharacterized protein n=1 Tax=Avena sativa TaxID=4498 RepID=A0ACD5YCC9_AVESA